MPCFTLYCRCGFSVSEMSAATAVWRWIGHCFLHIKCWQSFTTINTLLFVVVFSAFDPAVWPRTLCALTWGVYSPCMDMQEKYQCGDEGCRTGFFFSFKSAQNGFWSWHHPLVRAQKWSKAPDHFPLHVHCVISARHIHCIVLFCSHVEAFWMQLKKAERRTMSTQARCYSVVRNVRNMFRKSTARKMTPPVLWVCLAAW